MVLMFGFQDLVEDFVFPASKLIVEARNGSGKKYSVLISFSLITTSTFDILLIHCHAYIISCIHH